MNWTKTKCLQQRAYLDRNEHDLSPVIFLANDYLHDCYKVSALQADQCGSGKYSSEHISCVSKLGRKMKYYFKE